MKGIYIEPNPTRHILGRWMVAPMHGNTWGLAQCTKGWFKYYWLFHYCNFPTKEAAIKAYEHMTSGGKILS